MFAAGPPPAWAKRPVTWSAGPLPSSWTASANTSPSGPPGTADQLVPFQRARLETATPPAVVNFPAA
jgi:hypothetical protein